MVPSPPKTPPNLIQARLLAFAAAFLVFYSSALTLAPAVRLGSWQVEYNWGHWAGFGLWLAMAFLAHRTTSRRLPDRDPYLLPVALLLSGWGMLTIWRLFPAFGLRQSLWLLIAIGAFSAGLVLPFNLDILRRYKYLLLTGGLLLTGLTLLLGTNPAGASYPRLWLGCCGIYFQPSEPLKLLLIVFLAAYFSNGAAGERNGGSVLGPRLLPFLAPTLLMTGLALLLMLAQRDLGTASIFLFLFTTMVYIASGRKRVLLTGGLALLLAGIAGYALFDVVRLRIDAWLNPWADPSGRSFQIVQSLLAVANGGLIGRGPGMGSPGLVPVPHSDFIFAAIAEEAGLLGVIGLILLLALLAERGLRLAMNATDNFRRYLAAGLTAHLVAQSILIIGGNLRLLPLTGVTLPFVSYGGSSLLTSYLSLLFLVLISSHPEQEPAPLLFPQPYLHLGAFLFVGLAGAALVSGWWAVYRSPELLARADNPRRAITDRYVHRGSLLDRDNQPIAETRGQPGGFTRQINYPDLSAIVGYTNPIYGQAGLEESLDPYLRGTQAVPGLSLSWNRLLYGQPPPGLNVRTSLDLGLQQIADEALGDLRGALVLLNADSGEVLAMASHPTFNANRLETNWPSLVGHPDSPLLNRATLGLYPAGDLADVLFPGGADSPALDVSPEIRLPAGESTLASDGSLLVSPLQAALAAAALSNAGIRPALELVLAVETPQAGWVILPALEKSVQVRDTNEAQAAAEGLASEAVSLWENQAVAPNGPDQTVSWYVGGTLPAWEGSPLAVAVLLEEDDPAAAQSAGREILQAAMRPARK